MTELWDIYDKNRNKTGRTHLRGEELDKGDYHLVVCIWIMNSKNEVLLTKRHPDKLYGNYWECTGGSVVAGEDSLQGALREVNEEIGINLSGEEGILLGQQRRESDFVDTWMFKKNFTLDDIAFQPEEVIDARWVNKIEYDYMQEKGLIVPTLKNIWKLNPERDKRLTFNENVINYDRWRPTYCKELFEEIINYSNLNQNSKVIEVGIGTGQATGPFLRTGCKLMAVELGENLAEYSKDKFKEYKNFSVYNTSFENFKCEDNSIDLLYSATAFHWIPEDIGYLKILKLLKENGTLALFWNKPFAARDDEPLHQRIQRIYHKYRPSNIKLIENDTKRYEQISETIKSYGFRNVEVKLYHQTREFSSSEYISLLNTYSDHRTMPEHVKKLFEVEIENAILEYGDVIKIYDTIDLYLAKK